MTRAFDVVLVLSGGNALGAFHAGVYQALHEQDLLPDWVIGASAGAITGAMIVGSLPEHRVETLRSFWRPDAIGLGVAGSLWRPGAAEVARRSAAATWTLAAGRPGVFGPLLSSLNPWASKKPSLFETDQLVVTLNRLVDFELLNGSGPRFTATAVDLENGDDVVFDTRDRRVDARHIRASAAVPAAFPPVEIDGRWHIDGGVSANLPLDPVLANPPSRPTLCIAVDLLPLAQPRPKTLGEAASRMQDLIFAAQSRRSIERWRAAYAGRDDASVTLVRIAYTDQADEVVGKALDFSGPTIAQRWASGYSAAAGMIEQVAAGALPMGDAGLHVVD